MMQKKSVISDALYSLEDFARKEALAIKSWIDEHALGRQRILYNSVDVRCSGFKIIPVDTNVFPAGFHLLDEHDLILASNALSAYIKQYFAGAQKFLLITENFNRNAHYFKNVIAIAEIFKRSGYSMRIGSYGIDEDLLIDPSKNLYIECITRKNDKILIRSDSFEADIIVLNNDLTSGLPDILKGLKQVIIPDIKHGWYMRRKYQNLSSYDSIVKKFCHHFSLNSWPLRAHLLEYRDVDFKNKENIERLNGKLKNVLEVIDKDYVKYGVKEKPYAFIKANNGTFGMGIMSTDQIQGSGISLNKKARNTMSAIKGGVSNNEVVIQEGIKTAFAFDDYPAENMLYFIGGELVGSILRYNDKKNFSESLNSTGMHFINLNKLENQMPLRNIITLVARLAVLAVLYE